MSSLPIPEIDPIDDAYASCGGLTGATGAACRRVAATRKPLRRPRLFRGSVPALRRGARLIKTPSGIKRLQRSQRTLRKRNIAGQKKTVRPMVPGTIRPKMCYSAGLKRYVPCGSTGSGSVYAKGPQKCFNHVTKRYGPCPNIPGTAKTLVNTAPKVGVPGSGVAAETGAKLLTGEKVEPKGIIRSILDDIRGFIDVILGKGGAPPGGGAGAIGAPLIGNPRLGEQLAQSTGIGKGFLQQGVTVA